MIPQDFYDWLVLYVVLTAPLVLQWYYDKARRLAGSICLLLARVRRRCLASSARLLRRLLSESDGDDENSSSPPPLVPLR